MVPARLGDLRTIMTVELALLLLLYQNLPLRPRAIVVNTDTIHDFRFKT